MSDIGTGLDMSPAALSLTPEEKRVFGQLFQQADTEKIGVITGEVAVKFFERTKLAPTVLGEIWQIADTENRGLLTSTGFCMVLRLIGHYQAGRDPSPELAFRPGPLPKFETVNIPSVPAAVSSPAPAPIPPPPMGPIRVPPLPTDKAAEYAALFEKAGPQNGILPGETAKQIFERTRLPNEILGRIWNLADTEQRGALSVTEFIIAMHLLSSYKSRTLSALPTTLPLGLYDAAVKRGQSVAKSAGGQWPGDSSTIPRQLSGSNPPQVHGSASRGLYSPAPAPVEGEWLISAKEKSTYDSFFAKLDSKNRGHITGEQAVPFFSDSSLPADILAAIWDLADINSEGQLNRDEFAVAMHLIRQQRGKGAPQLPTALPPLLVPPSMRNQLRSSLQSSTPSSDNRAYNSQVSKSASEDLFGLDEFSALPPVQTQQSTGGSAGYARPFESDPFSNSKATSPSSSQTFPGPLRNAQSGFKPFTPTSAFGQQITSQSATSSGAGQGVAQQKSPASSQPVVDDLLGDNDPEVSKKLTKETTELANMSNQIGNLKSQLEDVQVKKSVAEHDFASTNNQKRDLELRLSQFRSQYEHDFKIVKSLEERLVASRNETRKLQQELAIVEGSYQDLQNQRRQISSALDADQRENATLKDQIRQLNNEINQLRPQLDKLRSDARQQKGLVAINKKQLFTNENERDKLKAEAAELLRGGPESSQSKLQEPTEVSNPQSSASQSTNPFFRKSPAPSTDKAMSPSEFAHDGRQPQMQNTFDNLFGSSYTPQPTSTAPSTSFRSDSHTPAFSVPSGQSVRSSEPDVPTPSTSPPLSSYHESPRVTEPPAPPESRQMSSSMLPLRNEMARSESFGSSVKVSTPTSRYEPTGADTPTSYGATISSGIDLTRTLDRGETPRTEIASMNSGYYERRGTASPATSAMSETAKPGMKTDEHRDTFQSFSPAGQDSSMPGAFPAEANPLLKPVLTGDSAPGDKTKSRASNSSRVDFDAAFAGFGSGRQNNDRHGTGGQGNESSDPVGRFNREFPPIKDLGHDEDSESNDEHGFADNFTPASPQRKGESNRQSQDTSLKSASRDSGSEDLYKSRLPMPHVESLTSQSATNNPPKSLSTYEQSMPQGSKALVRDPNQFPQEYGGLLPTRQESLGQAPSSTEKQFGGPGAGGQGQALFGGSSTKSAPPSHTTFSTSPPTTDTPSSTVPSDAYQSAVSYNTATEKPQSPTTSSAQPNRQTYMDDFDTGFDDLSEAREAEDRGDDDFMLAPNGRDSLDEFNPVFDSPAATAASLQTPTNRTGHPTDSFSDFEHLSQGFNQATGAQMPSTSSSHDWDAMFSGLDSSQLDRPVQETLSEHGGNTEERSLQLGRAISTGTEHDDPILKKLTGMGYPRADALDALEKSDYDINKAADYLTSVQRA